MMSLPDIVFIVTYVTALCEEGVRTMWAAVAQTRWRWQSWRHKEANCRCHRPLKAQEGSRPSASKGLVYYNLGMGFAEQAAAC